VQVCCTLKRRETPRFARNGGVFWWLRLSVQQVRNDGVLYSLVFCAK